MFFSRLQFLARTSTVWARDALQRKVNKKKMFQLFRDRATRKGGSEDNAADRPLFDVRFACAASIIGYHTTNPTHQTHHFSNLEERKFAFSAIFQSSLRQQTQPW